LILEFDTPLDIRNLRVATTGCDEIANHEPCSDAVVEAVHSDAQPLMYQAYYGELEDQGEEPEFARGEDHIQSVQDQILPRCHPTPCDCSCHQTPNGSPAYPVPRFEMISCHDDAFAETPAHKRVGCYSMVYEDDVPDLNIGAPTGALIYHLLKACAPDGSDGATCCAEFANDATVHYHGPVQPGLEHYPTESIYDDDDAANDEDGDPPPPRRRRRR